MFKNRTVALPEVGTSTRELTKITRVMTDFGGSGQGGTVAECELNLPLANNGTGGGSILTSSDLTQLGCALSNVARVESNDSGFSALSISNSNKCSSSQVIKSHVEIEPSSNIHDTQSQRASKDQCHVGVTKDMKKGKKTRNNASKHIVRSIIAAVTSGFSNCSRKNRSQANITTMKSQGGVQGARRHSDSEEDSNSADLFENNFKTNMKIRNISRDGTGFIIGSEATSTGYVSDSVDGYDKCKGLESEHGCGSHKSQHESLDSSLACEERQKKAQEITALLETSVTRSLSPKLNLNIKYDDDDDDEGDDDPLDNDQVKEESLIPQLSQSRAASDMQNLTPGTFVYVAEDDTDETEADSSSSTDDEDEDATGTNSNTGNNSSNNSNSNISDSDISDYDTNDSSSSYMETAKTKTKLDVIVEEYDDITDQDLVGGEPLASTTPLAKSNSLKKKASVKRKKSRNRTPSSTEQDLKNGMKSKLASLRNDLKKESDSSAARSNSLKDMIVQFETAVAALEISENQLGESDDEGGGVDDNNGGNSVRAPALLGVKAIAEKIQAKTKAVDEGFDTAQMPPSQILKLKQALDLDEERLAKPVPLSRRSESKVKLIAKQLADAEKRRLQMEKLARSQMCKSPKDIKKTASTSFINELLEMARAESEDKLNESSKVEEPHDFKQSLLAARKKITHREEAQTANAVDGGSELSNVATVTDGAKASNPKPTPGIQSPATIPEDDEVDEEGDNFCGDNFATTEISVLPTLGATAEEIDPFVREVLCSKTVPEPVKQKIRIECWSLFNDPRTPKGVKQCILATMLSKVQNE